MSRREKIEEQRNPTPLKKAERKVGRERERARVVVCARARAREERERVRREERGEREARERILLPPSPSRREREGSSAVSGARATQAGGRWLLLHLLSISARQFVLSPCYTTTHHHHTTPLFLSYCSSPIHLGKKNKKKVLGVSVSGMVHKSARLVLDSVRVPPSLFARLESNSPPAALIRSISICSLLQVVAVAVGFLACS
jgi:hypothetical protein